MLPQAATAVPRDRDSIEPGAETGPAGAPADSPLSALRPLNSLRHAMDYLAMAGKQWECGEAAAATNDAIALLRDRIAAIAAERHAPTDYQREYEALMAWSAQGWRAKQRYDEDCPDCGGTLRYYQSRDRWFCLMCEKSRHKP